MKYAWGSFLFAYCLIPGRIFIHAADAQAASFAQRLYGMWYSYPLGNPNTDSIRHEFRHNPATSKDEMIVTRLCQGDYRTVIARAVAPIEVSQSTIKVLKSVRAIEKGERNSECKASIDEGALGYVVSGGGDRISITNPGGVPDTFELARQDAASEALLPASLYGTWLVPLRQEHGATIQMKLVLYNSGDSTHGKIRQVSVCSKDNDSLLSQVESKVRITKDQITILEAASDEQRDALFWCTAKISAAKLHYVISPNGETMTLSKPGEPPVRLTREH